MVYTTGKKQSRHIHRHWQPWKRQPIFETSPRKIPHFALHWHKQSRYDEPIRQSNWRFTLHCNSRPKMCVWRKNWMANLLFDRLNRFHSANKVLVLNNFSIKSTQIHLGGFLFRLEKFDTISTRFFRATWKATFSAAEKFPYLFWRVFLCPNNKLH